MSNLEPDNETIEQMIKRYAQNRYEMRQHFKWRLEDTAEDDWRIASEIVMKEIYRDDK